MEMMVWATTTDRDNSEIATAETAKILGITQEEVTREITAREKREPQKSYIAGGLAHSQNDFITARKAWIQSAALGHGESMVQLAAYFMRGFGGVPYSYVGALALFRKALAGNLVQLTGECLAIEGLSRIEQSLVPKALREAGELVSCITELICSDKTKMVSGHEEGVLSFNYLLFPDFPDCPHSPAVNAIGFWDARISEGADKQSVLDFVRYNREVNAAKTLRGILGMRERNIFSEECRMRSLLCPIQRLIVEDGAAFGMLRRS